MAKSDNSETLEGIGQEIKFNPPAILEKTQAKYGGAKAKKQRIAILLSKGRRAGLKTPPRKTV